MEIRQKVVVIFLGALLSLLIVKYDREKAMIDAFAIGTVSALIGIISNWIFYRQYDLHSGGPNIFTWVEVLDYLAVGFAIPAIVAIIRKLSRRQQPSNNGVVQDAAKDAAPHTP
jgi:Na+/proline symporter